MKQNPLLIAALVITGAIAAWGIVDTAGLAGFAAYLVGIQFTSRAWFIMLAVSFMLIVSVWLALSRYGRIKLGQDDDDEEREDPVLIPRHMEVDELSAVRFRIDGVLHQIPVPATIRGFHAAIVSRVKIMANLNIAEKRLPQDGRIRIKIAGKDIDIRVATAPTSFGERITMRLLDRRRIMIDSSKAHTAMATTRKIKNGNGDRQ